MKAKRLILFGVLIASQLSADHLPPGVPRVVNPDGSLLFIDSLFTTEAFQEEGLRLAIAEANKVARELRLPEMLPIAKSNLTHSFISPFGYSYVNKRLGNVTTENYSYGVAQNYKFSDLTIANWEKRCFEIRDKYRWPLSKIDTNQAFKLAVMWMKALRMDVESLNRECQVKSVVSPFWNEVGPGEPLRGTTFVPIYEVSWLSPKNVADGSGCVAYVHLAAPEKKLLALTVYDSKYIQRVPVVFTNLAALFPGQATITTNWPVKPKVLDFGARPQKPIQPANDEL